MLIMTHILFGVHFLSTLIDMLSEMLCLSIQLYNSKVKEQMQSHKKSSSIKRKLISKKFIFKKIQTKKAMTLDAYIKMKYAE